MKIIYAKNPENSGTNLSDKDKNNLFKLEIQYEYHNFDGLNKYGVYDVIAQLENEKEKVSKRMIVVYRNDKTFEVETELNAQE